MMSPAKDAAPKLGLDMSQELEQGLNIKGRASIGYGQSERLGA